MNFNIRKELIIRLCEEVEKVFAQESSIISVRNPIKIFGNINGHFSDLMRLFDHFKQPTE
jgi:protein phosphatase